MFFYHDEEKPKSGRTDHKKEIIKTINSMSGSRSGYEIFSDWVSCMAIAIENSTHVFRNEIWQEREKLYKDTMNRYTLEERQKFPEMLAHLTMAFEEGPDDILGKVYMESGMGSRVTGQFFTPFNISEMVARLSLETSIEQYEKRGTGKDHGHGTVLRSRRDDHSSCQGPAAEGHQLPAGHGCCCSGPRLEGSVHVLCAALTPRDQRHMRPGRHTY